MYILAMETTGPNASAALLRAAEPGSAPEPEIIERAVLLGQQTSYEAKNHLKNLMPLIQKLLTTCGVEKSQLTHIAVSVGPGSFTGIRIGVSTARALAQALQLPCIAVPTLEVFCHAQAAKHAHTRAQGAQDEAVRAAENGARVVCGIINARRGQVYGIVDGYLPGGPYMLTDVLDVITQQVRPDGRPVLFYGDGMAASETAIESSFDDFNMKKDRLFFCTAERAPSKRGGGRPCGAAKASRRQSDGLCRTFAGLHAPRGSRSEAGSRAASDLQRTETGVGCALCSLESRKQTEREQQENSRWRNL